MPAKHKRAKVAGERNLYHAGEVGTVTRRAKVREVAELYLAERFAAGRGDEIIALVQRLRDEAFG